MEISVLMSTHNPKEDYFVKSVNSIINQSYRDFEFIIIDDGSTVDINELLKSNHIYDERIKVYRIDNNQGLAKALNYGIELCTGRYIARMDDDDISNVDRLYIQYTELKKNPDFVGCWSNFSIIDGDGALIRENRINIKYNKILKRIIEKGNFLAHSSLFICKDTLRELGGYDGNLKYAQDNDLYIRILEKYEMFVVDEVLLNFRKTLMRKNLYRDSLAQGYVFYSKYYFYLRNKHLLKYRIWYYKWMARFFLSLFIKK